MDAKKKKIWHLPELSESEQADIAALSRQTGMSMACCTVLYRRGYRTAESAKAFMVKQDTHFADPFLLRDMDRAVRRIRRAISGHEPITVYGDYDVDGVTSVSVLVLYLRSRGAIVHYYIPNRNGEGYGINRLALKRLADDGTRLIVTVDTGVTAVEEVDYARELGMDVVITDHHECLSVLPRAEAVVNCRRTDCSYPFKELAGVGVVFKLICALEMGEPGKELNMTRNVCRDYLDLVAVGTVADVMPLVGENRLIVSLGLSMMESHARPGIAALLETASHAAGQKTRKRKISSSLIGFTIAPRLNAAGRLASATEAVELFLNDTPSRAHVIAERLCQINTLRQEEENRITKEAMAELEHISPDDPVIVLAKENWHQGVIGIVSSRLTELYNRPSVLISFENGMGKGSGRSVKGLNLVDALADSADLLERFGGHELAAGLTIRREQLEAFRRRINDYARSVMPHGDLPVTLELDAELTGRDLTLREYDELSAMEPFGSGNPTPLFFVREARVLSVTGVGQNKHTKLLLEKDGVRITAMYFGHAADSLDLFENDRCDIAAQLDVNEYQGLRTLQMIVRDLRLPPEVQDRIHAENAVYDEMTAGGEWNYPPLSRDDFVRIYSYVRNRIRIGQDRIGLREIEREYGARDGSLAAVRLMLAVLCEVNVLCMEEAGSAYRFALPQTPIISLEQSALYRRLHDKSERN